MIGVGQARIVWIAPAFSIEMQTKHEIGMQFKVHQSGPASNLAVTIEQNFALPADGLLFRSIVWIKNVGARLWHAVFDQNFSGELTKIIRTFRRDRFVTIPHKENFGAEFTQSRGQQSRHAQREIAFLDRRAVTHLKPALLHLCPFPAEMTRVQCDFQTEKRFLRSDWR